MWTKDPHDYAAMHIYIFISYTYVFSRVYFMKNFLGIVFFQLFAVM